MAIVALGYCSTLYVEKYFMRRADEIYLFFKPQAISYDGVYWQTKLKFNEIQFQNTSIWVYTIISLLIKHKADVKDEIK